MRGRRLTTKDFINKAKKVHKNIYDYSLVKYKNAIEKVVIVCVKHGKFKQAPCNHLQGQGCHKCAIISCANKARKSKKQFISDAKKVHGDKYDYSKVRYRNGHKKVTIICPIHKEFKQEASAHTRGRGCSKCSHETIRMGLKEFIRKSRKVHNDRYDYSKVVYKNNREKVCIVCKIHGDFWQIPDNHYRLKCNCLKCSGCESSTTEEFVKKAKKIHNCIYNYNNVNYKKNDIKVKIGCRKHGEFLQTPSHHLRGTGCPKCAHNYRMTQEDFIEKAKKAHNNKYDYSKIQYKGIKDKGIIICKKHGEFEQQLDNHLYGKGCSHCILKSEGEVKIFLLEYFKDWIIITHKKIWDSYRNYNHRRYCDFWLEKDNIKIMLEYDGKHHMVPVSFGCRDEQKVLQGFKHIKRKDRLDAIFCKENNIILHRIKYNEDKDKSIRELLEKIDDFN